MVHDEGRGPNELGNKPFLIMKERGVVVGCADDNGKILESPESFTLDIQVRLLIKKYNSISFAKRSSE